MNEALSLLRSGGIVMIPLLICSVTVLSSGRLAEFHVGLDSTEGSQSQG